MKKIKYDVLMKKKRRYNILMLIAIIAVGILVVVTMVQEIRYEVMKKGFTDFTKFQLEALNYCVNQTGQNFTSFMHDFGMHKAEEIIMKGVGK